MTNGDLHWITNYIWGIADDVLRDVYVRGKYRDVSLPMTVLRRLDAVLEPTKQDVLDMKARLDEQGIVEQRRTLGDAADQAFYNISKCTLNDLSARASRQQLRADFEDHLDRFSCNVQDILDNFEFRNQIPRLDKRDVLGTLIEKIKSPELNLSLEPVKTTDGSVRHPVLRNHGMGTIFEELIRRFNEENNEEAGEHFTPRDAVRLMAKLVFLPAAEKNETATSILCLATKNRAIRFPGHSTTRRSAETRPRGRVLDETAALVEQPADLSRLAVTRRSQARQMILRTHTYSLVQDAETVQRHPGAAQYPYPTTSGSRRLNEREDPKSSEIDAIRSNLRRRDRPATFHLRTYALRRSP